MDNQLAVQVQAILAAEAVASPAAEAAEEEAAAAKSEANYKKAEKWALICMLKKSTMSCEK